MNNNDTGGLPIPPLSDEWLAEIRERLRQVIDDSVLTHTGRSIGDVASQRVIDDIWPLITAREAALLADRERLLAVARVVADVNATNGSDPDDMHWPCCAFSSTCEPVWSEHFIEWRHAVDCPVTQARAALADAEAEAQEKE